MKASPARFLLFVLLVIVGLKASEQLYGVVAFGDERREVRRLLGQLAAVGGEMVAVSAQMDSLRERLAGDDAVLEGELASLQRYYRQSRHNRIPLEIYPDYMAELTRYNLHVESCNALQRRWQELRAQRESLAVRYGGAADSIQALAVRMGEPFYQVPTPAEAAAGHP